MSSYLPKFMVDHVSNYWVVSDKNRAPIIPLLLTTMDSKSFNLVAAVTRQVSVPAHCHLWKSSNWLCRIGLLLCLLLLNALRGGVLLRIVCLKTTAKKSLAMGGGGINVPVTIRNWVYSELKKVYNHKPLIIYNRLSDTLTTPLLVTTSSITAQPCLQTKMIRDDGP